MVRPRRSQTSHHMVARKMILASHRKTTTQITLRAVLFPMPATFRAAFNPLTIPITGADVANLDRICHNVMSQDALCQIVVTKELKIVQLVMPVLKC